jgi:hypothetical protein
MEIIRKLRDNFHSPREVLLFCRVFLLITVLPLLIRFLTLPGLMKVLTWRVPGTSGTRHVEDYRNRVVKFTDYLLSREFWIFRRTCLKRCLVLYHFLCPMFPDLHLCFGVRVTKDDGRKGRDKALYGHSWLICNGEVFLEDKPETVNKYTVTYRFPEGPRRERTISGETRGLSRESRLLLYCAQVNMPEDKASELDDFISRPLNWESISEAALSFNIPGLLYHNLKGLPNSRFVPPGIMEGLRKAYHRNVARNMYLYEELKTLVNAFQSQGMEVIALKGAALAGVVYRDAGLRPMMDIDLLVKEDDLPAARRVMADLNYSAADKIRSEQWYRKNHFHLPPYRHAEKPVVVEIHWHFTGAPVGIDIRKWWKRAVCMNLTGCRILVPSPEDMLVHLCLHLFNHGYESRFVLRGMCDISEILRHYESEIDWELLMGEIKGQATEKQVHTMLYLVKKLYGLRADSFGLLNLSCVDHKFLTVLEKSLFAADGKAPINPHLLKSMMIDNPLQKTRFLLSKIFPSRREISRVYHVSPVSKLLFIYYLARPFHLMAKYGRSAEEICRTKVVEKEEKGRLV